MASLSNLSARHQQLINAIIKNLGNADINWEAVAADANFSSAKYAKDEYRKARKVLDAGDGNGNGTPAKKGGKATKRKTSDEDGEDEEPTTATKAKKSASKGKKGGKESAEQDDPESIVKAEANDSDDGDLI